MILPLALLLCSIVKTLLSNRVAFEFILIASLAIFAFFLATLLFKLESLTYLMLFPSRLQTLEKALKASKPQEPAWKSMLGQ